MIQSAAGRLPQIRTLVVRIEKHYGRVSVYPVCNTAQLLANLARQTTLTPKSLQTIQLLGYTIEIYSGDEDETTLKEYICSIK